MGIQASDTYRCFHLGPLPLALCFAHRSAGDNMWVMAQCAPSGSMPLSRMAALVSGEARKVMSCLA